MKFKTFRGKQISVLNTILKFYNITNTVNVINENTDVIDELKKHDLTTRPGFPKDNQIGLVNLGESWGILYPTQCPDEFRLFDPLNSENLIYEKNTLLKYKNIKDVNECIFSILHV